MESSASTVERQSICFSRESPNSDSGLVAVVVVVVEGGVASSSGFLAFFAALRLRALRGGGCVVRGLAMYSDVMLPCTRKTLPFF